MDDFKGKILRYGSFFLVLMAPIIFWNHRLFPHISSKTFFIHGVVGILFFVWLYVVTVNPTYRFSKKMLLGFLPAILFVFWMTLASIFSSDFGLSFWSSLGRGTGLLTIYYCLALSFVIASLVKVYKMKYLESLLQWFVVGGVILATSVWFGTDGFSLPIKVFSKDAGGGFAGNSTLTAGYLLFVFGASFFLLFSKSVSKVKKWLIGLGVLVAIFSPVFVSLYGLLNGNGILGTARGTILALGAGLVGVWLGYMFLSSKKIVKGLSIGIFSLGLVIFAVLWGQLINPQTALNQKFREQARETRFIFWDVSKQAMSKSPIFGYGPENFSIAFQDFFNPQVLVLENSFEGWVDRAHNIYYDLGVSGGYPLIILYAVFILSLFYALYLSYKNGYFSRIQTAILAGLFLAYIVNLLFTFESNISLMALFVLSGVLYSLKHKGIENNNTPQTSISREDKNFIALGLFVLFTTSWIFFAYMPAMKSKAYAETFAAGIDNRPKMYSELLKGSRVGEHKDISGLAHETYKLYGLNPRQTKDDKVKLPYLIKNLEALIDHLYKVVERNETDYRLYITIASLENTLSYLSERPYDQALTDKLLGILEKAKSLSPTNPNVYWNIAQVEAWRGDMKAVEEAYRAAIAIDPKFAASHRLFIKFAQALGNQKLYNEALLQAQKDIPGFSME